MGTQCALFRISPAAFVVGGKLANASSSLVAHDTVRSHSWLIIIIKFIVAKALLTLRILTTGVIQLLSVVRQAMRAVRKKKQMAHLLNRVSG